LAFAAVSLLAGSDALAIPQFARRYNIKCSACHTIAPALNEQGSIFKRLGFHLPPALEAGKKAPTISDLVKKEPAWSLANNAALAVADFSYSNERTTQEGQSPSTTSSFQVGAWNVYFAGWIPDTNAFYFSEFDIVAGGTTVSNMAQAYVGYAGGNARSSWYVTAGRGHLQMTEGPRGAQVYSLLPNSPLPFEISSPTNFMVDQSPVGLALGYTWASSAYRQVLAATVKVTNGDNADGTEILGPSSRNSKDVWADVDFWFAPESGISAMLYRGRKDQTQTDPTGAQFTYAPYIRREGVFANYKVLSKVDLIGGYVHSNDDWEGSATGPLTSFVANDTFAAVDYYVRQGIAISGRYDLLHQTITGSGGMGRQSFHDWTAGLSVALTPSGNVVGRAAYSNKSGNDPMSATKSTDRLVEADVAVSF
jgi:hypothetical protein